MGVNPKEPIRRHRARQDLGTKESIVYNDAAGADKVVIIDPPIKKAIGASAVVGAGKYIKVNGTSYTLDLIGRAYDPSKTYRRGDIVSEGSFIYMALEDNITGTFDSSKWKQVADKQISGIPVENGNVVTTGRWHNTITTAGWLVDDESDAVHYQVRD